MRSTELRQELAGICELFRKDSTPISEQAIIKLEHIIDVLPEAEEIGALPETSALYKKIRPLIEDAVRRNGNLRSRYGSPEQVDEYTRVAEALLRRFGPADETFSKSEFAHIARTARGRDRAGLTTVSPALRGAGLVETTGDRSPSGGYETFRYRLTNLAKSLAANVQPSE